MTGLPPGTRIRVVANVIGRRGALGTVVAMPPRLANGWDVFVALSDGEPGWPLGFARHEIEVVDEP